MKPAIAGLPHPGRTAGLEGGSCSGIENYSRHIDGRAPGQAPHTLIDFFPDDFLLVIDESHVTVPQLHGQYEGDRSRKATLVEHERRCAARSTPFFEEGDLDALREVAHVELGGVQ